MRYVLIRNKTIIEGPKELPKSWNNTSGFHHLSQTELQELGWVPYHYQYLTEELKDDETYSTPIISIKNDAVYEIHTTRKKTKDELKQEADQKIEDIRSKRDKLLTQSDWMVTGDSPYDTKEIRIYRQALRDITKQEGFPDSIVWPDKP